MSVHPTQTRRGTPLPLTAYTVYPFYSSVSLRYAARSPKNVIIKSSGQACRWVQRLVPELGSSSANPRDTRRIFVDETMVNVGGIPALIWVALEPHLRATLDFQVSPRGSSFDVHISTEQPRRKH